MHKSPATNDHAVLTRWRLLVAVMLTATHHVAAQSVGSAHDCFRRDPESTPYQVCRNPLVEDKNCTVLFGDSVDSWKRMDCDVAAIWVPAAVETNKFMVVHAGVCDAGTEQIGTYYDRNRKYNLYMVTPCAGLAASKCFQAYGYETCPVLHLSWAAYPEMMQALGMQGLNPPELIDPYRSDNRSRFVFFHETSDTPGGTYAWERVGCDNDTNPTYVCVAGDDPNYDAKWKRMRPLLMKSLNNLPTFPCRVEVIDARPSAAVPPYATDPPHNRFPNIPCSGLYPSLPNPGWAWEMSAKVTAALSNAIALERPTRTKESTPLANFRKAIDIALEN